MRYIVDNVMYILCPCKELRLRSNMIKPCVDVILLVNCISFLQIYYKDKPLAAFTIPSMSSAERADGNLQETPNGSSEAQEVQQVEKNIVSSFDLSKLLSANCKIHLISDNELIPTASILPHDFWSWNFDDIDIDPEWLDF